MEFLSLRGSYTPIRLVDLRVPVKLEPKHIIPAQRRVTKSIPISLQVLPTHYTKVGIPDDTVLDGPTEFGQPDSSVPHLRVKEVMKSSLVSQNV